MSRGNKAQRDPFIDIPAEAKEMMRYIYPAIQHMSKAERMDGVGHDMKRAALDIIEEYYMAYYAVNAEVKADHICRMIGKYGVLQAAVEVACQQGILLERYRLPIAYRMERIEEGIQKWNNAMSAPRQGPARAPHGKTRDGAAGQRLRVKGDEVSFTPAADTS